MEQSTSDHAVREFSRLTLNLRAELTFTPQTAGSDVFYVVEDPVNSKFHRIGVAEYTFISLLDGKTSVADAMRLAANASSDSALTEQQAATICKWLVDSRLAYTEESAQPTPQADEDEPQTGRTWQRFNPVSARIPLVCPERIFDRVAVWFGWTHAPMAFVGWFAVVGYAIYVAASQWDRFAAASQGILAPGNWLAGIMCYLALKCLHEISHGVSCRRYGGSIREAGVLLILLMPIPYVDATSSWRFTSKWQRLHVAAAGMYIELCVAAVAVVVWDCTQPGLINQACYNLAIAGSVLTLLFNANPLMRFDGYYILSDLVEIPNLYSSGQEYWKRWAKRWLLGIEEAKPYWSKSRTWIIPLFGLAALFWRVFICASLAIGASVLFQGAGIVLSCLALCMWLGIPTVRLARYLTGGDHGRRPQLLRFSSAMFAGVAVLTFVLFALPWPGRISAPGVVEYRPTAVIRTASPGFLREILVSSGQSTRRGEIVAILENPALDFELADLEIAIKQSEIRCRAYRNSQKMTEYQAEYEQQIALVKRRQEKQAQVDNLTIRATANGQVISRGLESLVGKYFDVGAEILRIGDETRKQLTVSISQDDVEAFRTYHGRIVSFRMASAGWFHGPLAQLEPQADVALPHAALAASAGGPLAVRAAAQRNSQQRGGQEYDLVNPRFAGEIELGRDASLLLYAGQRATARIRPFDRTVGSHLYQTIVRWIRNSVEAGRLSDS